MGKTGRIIQNGYKVNLSYFSVINYKDISYWLKENCKGLYYYSEDWLLENIEKSNPHIENYVIFESQKDATLFKLTWS